MFLMLISITSELSWLHLSCDWYDKVNVIILFIWFQNYNWSGIYIEIKYSNFTYCYYFCIYMKSSEIWLIQFWFWDYPLLKHQNHWQWVLQNLTLSFFLLDISVLWRGIPKLGSVKFYDAISDLSLQSHTQGLMLSL